MYAREQGYRLDGEECSILKNNETTAENERMQDQIVPALSGQREDGALEQRPHLTEGECFKTMSILLQKHDLFDHVHNLGRRLLIVRDLFRVARIPRSNSLNPLVIRSRVGILMM